MADNEINDILDELAKMQLRQDRMEQTVQQKEAEIRELEKRLVAGESTRMKEKDEQIETMEKSDGKRVGQGETDSQVTMMELMELMRQTRTEMARLRQQPPKQEPASVVAGGDVLTATGLVTALQEVQVGQDLWKLQYTSTMKMVNQQLLAYEGETARGEAETQAIIDVLDKFLAKTPGGAPGLDSMSALFLFYASNMPTKAERTQFLRVLARGSAAEIQLTHNALMLSRMPEEDRNTYLQASHGKSLLAPYPLFPTPTGEHVSATLTQKVRRANRDVLSMPVEATGGETRTVGLLGPMVGPMTGTGFSHRYAVVGGGQLPHVTNEDGTTATDTTDLEGYLNRQQAENARYRKEIVDKLNPMYERMLGLERAVTEAKSGQSDAVRTLSERVAEIQSTCAETTKDITDLAASFDSKLLDLSVRTTTAERGANAGDRFRMMQEHLRNQVRYRNPPLGRQYPGLYFY